MQEYERDVCSICQDTVEDGDAYRLPCGHKLHPWCLLTWWCEQKSSMRCPLCMKIVHEVPPEMRGSMRERLQTQKSLLEMHSALWNVIGCFTAFFSAYWFVYATVGNFNEVDDLHKLAAMVLFPIALCSLCMCTLRRLPNFYVDSEE